MNRRYIGAVAAAVTLLSLAGRWGPDWLLGRQIDGWIDGGVPGVLPLLGTLGQTVSFYSNVVSIVEQLVPLVVGVALGVWLARRVASEERRGALRAVAVGSTAVVAVPAVAAVVVWGGLDPASLAMGLVLATNVVVAGPVFITVAAAAGVTFESLGLFAGGDAGAAGAEPTATETAEEVESPS